MPTLSRCLLLAGLLSGLVSGCNRAEAGADDPPGVPVVRSGEKGAWGDKPKWRVEPGIHFGAEGDSVQFGRIVGLAVDGLGRAWVADAHQHAIFVIDASGNLVRTIGRKGGGPAEFQSLSGIAVGPDGNVWAQDGANRKYAVFDTSGALVTTHRRENDYTAAPWPGRFDRSGRLYDITMLGLDGPMESRREAVLRFGRDLQPTDTFALPAFENPVWSITTRNGSDTRVTQVAVPFAGQQLWAIDPDGYVWEAVSDRYRFTRYDMSGKVDRIVERDVAAKPISRAERDRMLENFREFERKGGKIDRSRIPSTHTAFMRFAIDDTGHLLVWPSTGRGVQPGLDVFDPSGRYLGRLPLPERIQPLPAPVFHRDQMVAVIQAPDRTEHIATFRIHRLRDEGAPGDGEDGFQAAAGPGADERAAGWH